MAKRQVSKKKKVVKKRKTAYKSVTTVTKKYTNPRRAESYTVKKGYFQLKRRIDVRNINSLRSFEKKFRVSSRKFHNRNAKGSKRIYYSRFEMDVQRGKYKFKSGFSLRTRKIRNNAEFESYISEFLKNARASIENYLNQKVKISISGFSIQVEGKYATTKSKSSTKKAKAKAFKNKRMRHRK